MHHEEKGQPILFRGFLLVLFFGVALTWHWQILFERFAATIWIAVAQAYARTRIFGLALSTSLFHIPAGFLILTDSLRLRHHQLCSLAPSLGNQ